MVVGCTWLAALEVGDRWLAGWRSLLRQNQFSGFSDAQDVLLSLVDDDHLSGPLHQISGADPSALGPREMRLRRTGLGWYLGWHDRY
jgi:hypothetical protein